MLGKTAYAKGQKIYGNYNVIGKPGATTDYNPDSPYPQTVTGYYVYGEDPDTIEVNDFNFPEAQVGQYKYDFSSDGNLLVAVNANAKKIYTYKKLSDGSYGKSYNQDGELLTPEYTFEELGISTENGHTFAAIKLSPMNTDGSVSGYECKLAILTVKTTKSYPNEPPFRCYIYKISTKSGTIQTTNNNFQAGASGEEETYTSYNKWIITSSEPTSEYHHYQNSNIVWSPYDDCTLVILAGSKSTTTSMIADGYVYQIDKALPGSEDYSISTHLRDTLGANIGAYSLNFLSGNQIIQYQKNSFPFIKAYSADNFSAGHEISTGKRYTFNNDCSLAITYNEDEKKLYEVNINYADFTATFTEIKNIQCLDCSATIYAIAAISAGDNYFAISINNQYAEICKIDWTNDTIQKLYSVDASGSRNNGIFITADKKTFYLVDSSVITRVKTVPDTTNIIGVNYNGVMYYKKIIKVGQCTALPSDVALGKTFIGFQGTIQTGTGGGSTDEQ